MSLLYVFIFTLTCIRVYSMLIMKNCKSKRTLVGKVVIVTGANSGIGFETARELARRGARVILACRSEQRGTAARDRIILETGNKNIVYRHLDLSSLASVKKFASHTTETEEYLHVLINNAGVHGFSDTYTSDRISYRYRIVESMQINYFGPFLLTLLLLPLLMKSKSSRIVNVTSVLHFFGKIDLDHINVKGYYGSTSSYSNSKLCMMSSTVELARRLATGSVTVNAVHPGFILTNISSHSNLFDKAWFTAACLLFGRTVRQGAQTVVHLAVSEQCEGVSGKYFVDCAEHAMSRKASDRDIAKRLWKCSENLVGFEESKSFL